MLGSGFAPRVHVILCQLDVYYIYTIIQECIYVYMHLYPRMLNCYLKLMSWGVLDRLVTAGLAFRDLSSALTCPIHCGQSSLFPFISGLSLGILLGFICSFLLGFYLLRLSSSPGFPPGSGFQKAIHPRLRAYCE